MARNFSSPVLLLLAVAGCGKAPHYLDLDGGKEDADATVDAGATADADAGSAIDADVTPSPDAAGGVVEGMIQIPAGGFWRGCNPSNPNPSPCDSTTLARESPYREITLAEFWIDRTEVAQEDYAACVEANACGLPVPVPDGYEGGYDPANKPDHPVSSLTWANARSYCLWRGKRLPTEAEWERAARGDDGRMYPWGNSAPTCERLNGAPDCSTQFGTHAVGSHPTGASPYGALDMAGNVLEYVADFYSATYYQIAPDVNPPGPSSGTARVLRGGGFGNTEIAFRVSYRYAAGDQISGYSTGFRCAFSE